jgi:hypothetical protein
MYEIAENALHPNTPPKTRTLSDALFFSSPTSAQVINIVSFNNFCDKIVAIILRSSTPLKGAWIGSFEKRGQI